MWEEGNDRFLAVQTSQGSRKRGDASGTGESYPLFPLLSFVPRVHSNADSSLSLSPSLSTGKQKVGRKSFIACLPHRNCCIKRPRAKKPCDRPWSSPVVTSLPRGGARITHVFVPRGVEGVEGRGGEETFFSQVDARVRTVYCFPFRNSARSVLSCALTCDKQTAFPWNCTRFEGSIFTVFFLPLSLSFLSL